MKKPRHFLENFSASFSSRSQKSGPWNVDFFVHPFHPNGCPHCAVDVLSKVLFYVCVSCPRPLLKKQIRSYMVSTDQHCEESYRNRHKHRWLQHSTDDAEGAETKEWSSRLATDCQVSVSWSSIIVN